MNKALPKICFWIATRNLFASSSAHTNFFIEAFMTNFTISTLRRSGLNYGILIHLFKSLPFFIFNVIRWNEMVRKIPSHKFCSAIILDIYFLLPYCSNGIAPKNSICWKFIVLKKYIKLLDPVYVAITLNSAKGKWLQAFKVMEPFLGDKALSTVWWSQRNINNALNFNNSIPRHISWLALSFQR